MYIIGLNSEQNFYFVSTEDQRSVLETRGIKVLSESYERLTTAAAVVKELNQKDAYLLSQRILKTCRA